MARGLGGGFVHVLWSWPRGLADECQHVVKIATVIGSLSGYCQQTVILLSLQAHLLLNLQAYIHPTDI